MNIHIAWPLTPKYSTLDFQRLQRSSSILCWWQQTSYGSIYVPFSHQLHSCLSFAFPFYVFISSLIKVRVPYTEFPFPMMWLTFLGPVLGYVFSCCVSGFLFRSRNISGSHWRTLTKRFQISIYRAQKCAPREKHSPGIQRGAGIKEVICVWGKCPPSVLSLLIMCIFSREVSL